MSCKARYYFFAVYHCGRCAACFGDGSEMGRQCYVLGRDTTHALRQMTALMGTIARESVPPRDFEPARVYATLLPDAAEAGYPREVVTADPFARTARL